MTSASTLARQARAEKNHRKAAMLRKRAAKLRREEREAKKPPNKIIKGLHQALEHVDYFKQESGGWKGIDARAASPDAAPLAQLNQEQPGRGEIVGGKLAQKAEVISKMARQKGGVDAIQHMLTQIESLARYEAQRSAEERFTKERIAIGQSHRDRIVCAFLAKVETMEMMRNGIPKTAIIDGLTIAKVADALHAAGYTAQGKR